jgi:hypothetical protein
MKVQLDFSSPENCIKTIMNEGDALAALLYNASTDVYKADEALLHATAKLSLGVRSNTAVKMTEGMVQAAIDADADLSLLRLKAGECKARLSAIRADLDNLHDTRRMFVAWMQGQRAAGLEV